MPFADDLELLVRARYPILYLVTAEEARALELVQEVGRRRRKNVLEWSCTTGLVPAGTSIQSPSTRQGPSRDPLAALDAVIDLVEPCLVVFKDLHPFLSRSHATVIRRLKDIAAQLRHSAKTLILISPVLEIPPELDKDITVLNLPLPDAGELGLLLNRVGEELAGTGRTRMDLEPSDRDRLLQAMLGLSLGEAENVLARILVRDGALSTDAVDQVYAEKQQVIRKSGLLEYHPSRETFAEIGGLEALKGWLIKRAAALTPAARQFGLPAPRGILLLGVQGCGKSLCAKAIAHQWRLPLLRFDVGRLFGSLIGSSEENTRRAIAIAESVAPAVLWVDEIDKALAGIRGSAASDGGTAARVFGTFLTWLSEKTAPVFVVATANDISELPPELLRKGRLDEIFFVDLPSPAERRDIFSIHLGRRGRDPAGFDLEALVAGSPGFSGAEIEQAVVAALFDAFDQGSALTTAHLLSELGQAVPLSRTMAEDLERLRTWASGRARNAGCPIRSHPEANPLALPRIPPV